MRYPLTLVCLLVLAACALAGAQEWRDPSPHQVRWITVDSSIRLEVLDWEGSGPPLVLLGCYLSAHSYDEFAPKLTNQFHVYGITRRGIGASDKPATGYAVQRSVDDLLEVLDSLKAQKSLTGRQFMRRAGSDDVRFAAFRPSQRARLSRRSNRPDDARL